MERWRNVKQAPSDYNVFNDLYTALDQCRSSQANLETKIVAIAILDLRIWTSLYREAELHAHGLTKTGPDSLWRSRIRQATVTVLDAMSNRDATRELPWLRACRSVEQGTAITDLGPGADSSTLEWATELIAHHVPMLDDTVEDFVNLKEQLQSGGDGREW